MTSTTEMIVLPSHFKRYWRILPHQRGLRRGGGANDLIEVIVRPEVSAMCFTFWYDLFSLDPHAYSGRRTVL